MNRILSKLTKIEFIKKINNLNIKNSDVDLDNDPYVRLDDETIFFGNNNDQNTPLFLYSFLSSKTKKHLDKKCLQVAIDIVIRYVEQGLKYGGPKKMSRYQIQAGDKVTEMGGYQGFCSIKLAQQVGKSGKVIVIEPMKDNYRLLEKNKNSNMLDQMLIVNKGVWDSNTVLTFNRRRGDGQSSSIGLTYGHEEQFSINVDTLDNIFSELDIFPSNFMIIQLNGAEFNALKGLTLFKPKNLSIAARYDLRKTDTVQDIRELLTYRGYKVDIEEEHFIFGCLLD